MHKAVIRAGGKVVLAMVICFAAVGSAPSPSKDPADLLIDRFLDISENSRRSREHWIESRVKWLNLKVDRCHTAPIQRSQSEPVKEWVDKNSQDHISFKSEKFRKDHIAEVQRQIKLLETEKLKLKAPDYVHLPELALGELAVGRAGLLPPRQSNATVAGAGKEEKTIDLRYVIDRVVDVNTAMVSVQTYQWKKRETRWEPASRVRFFVEGISTLSATTDSDFNSSGAFLVSGIKDLGNGEFLVLSKVPLEERGSYVIEQLKIRRSPKPAAPSKNPPPPNGR